MRLAFFGFILIGGQMLYGQIINIESLRLTADSTGLSGKETFLFNITKNTTRLINLNNNLALQYKHQKSAWLFLSDVNFTFSNRTNFEKGGFFHGRYNYIRSGFLTYEAFLQYQVDIPLRIEKRFLVGLGPRFSFLNTDKNALVLGTLIMFENDHELNNDVEHSDVRLSTYISSSVRGERLGATVLLYYQPRIDYWEDFRISAQAQLEVKLWKALSLSIMAGMGYDSFPVEDPGIPNLTYKITNGLSYVF